MSPAFDSIRARLGLNKLPTPREMVHIIRSLSLRERIIFYTLAVVFIVSSIYFFEIINKKFIEYVPARGGSLTEGIVGVPHFINPLLANSDTDKDLVTLVYSGLLRPGPGGAYLPDLAESYTLSEDGRTYSFKLRKNATFHDGKPVTSADVAFTIKLAQDKTIKSPKLPNWEGVTVETPDPLTVLFILKKPYAPFLENTTLGILPKHIWQSVPGEEFSYSTHNASPTGSGPYKISSTNTDSGGIPKEYTLSAFSRFTLGRPYIETLHLKFYSTEDKLARAYLAKDVEAVAGLSPEILKTLGSKARTEHAPLPRIFALFFNQNQATILADKTIRKALADSIDQQELIDLALAGYGTPLSSVIPPNTIDSSLDNASSVREKTPVQTRIATARESLLSAGWSYDSSTKELVKKTKKDTTTLTISIATINAPELRKVAERVAEIWNLLGAHATVEYYEYGDLTQNVIRPRKFDVLLFGTVVGRFPDPYAFWHSSQRLDPGLNIAQYTNLTADKVLDQARQTVDRVARIELYKKLDAEISADIPAVFLYAPSLVYIVPEHLGGITLSGISAPNERFFSIYNWYVEQDAVWKIFGKH